MKTLLISQFASRRSAEMSRTTLPTSTLLCFFFTELALQITEFIKAYRILMICKGNRNTYPVRGLYDESKD